MSEKVESVKVQFTRENYKLLEKGAKEEGVSVDEYVDQIVCAFIDHFEGVEVTFKVPGRLMRLVEGESFFGWTKQEFFVNSVRALISCIVAEMKPEETEAWDAKYGYDIDKATYYELPGC